MNYPAQRGLRPDPARGIRTVFRYSPTEFLISKILAAGAARGRAWVGPTRARVFQTRVARARVGLALTHTLDGRLASFASGRGGCAAVCGARTPGGR